MALQHEPVLMAEAMELLAVRPGGLYVDGTVGLGGHAREILERSAPHGQLLAVDRDAETLAEAKTRLAEYGERARFVHADYRELPRLIGEDGVDGVLLDLGISSAQLDDADRGFSFQADGPLDMRMDRSRGATAAEALNQMEEHELADVIYRFGEERRSRHIARAIVSARQRTPFARTGDLASLVRRSSRSSGRRRLDPATRTFQAFRIYVNRELEGLGAALDAVARRLSPGGRLVVIAFHSLEDREVKQAFRSLAIEGFRLLTKKPVRPGQDEVRRNPRSRSARLRCVERRPAEEVAA